MPEINLRGKKALVMGLGLHGGGLESTRYLKRCGAEVTCTDLRDAETLKPTLEALSGTDVRFVLGEHRREDFDQADLIVKNPAVPADSPWLAGRTNVETDISLFLQGTEAPLIAVTGSKGKSTVVSALHNILIREFPETRLGGNITVSPLSFMDEIDSATPVILELSSWQLADLRGRGILRPRIACITNLMHDHQNRYRSFDDYEADKTVIFESVNPAGSAVFPDNPRGRSWSEASPAPSVRVRETALPEGIRASDGAWLDADGRGWLSEAGGPVQILPADLKVPGGPFRLNMLFASTIARLWGCRPDTIMEAQSAFRGVSYRMELFLQSGGIRFYDDTAATIPDAAAAAVRSIDGPVVLIAGGTDKSLEFAPFREVARIPRRIVLLPGSATDTLVPILLESGANIDGPVESMDQAVNAALEAAKPGDAVILSPGAASFGLFRHEFERGDRFKDSCRRLAAERFGEDSDRTGIL